MVDVINLLDYSLEALAHFLRQEWQEPAYRAQQIIQWVHQRGVLDFNAMTNLSKSLREKLKAHAVLSFPEASFESFSQDGTCKWLFRLHDGNHIETVFIPDKDRGTLCISSQVGCALNCDFCSTGKQGFNRNLSLGEIIGQLWLARHRLQEKLECDRPITNVVMMGMGEPLLNYGPVLASLSLMMSDHAYGLSKYRVTVSTSGVVPAMLDLKRDSKAALAVSLHAPNNALREQIVPLNKKYPLELLIPACRDYFSSEPRREVTFEYVMLDGVNDQLSHADELIALLRGISCKINLIPFNPFLGTRYRTSPMPQVLRFQRRLREGGFGTWVRRTRGEDIDAACGQLAGDFHDRTGRKLRLLRDARAS